MFLHDALNCVQTQARSLPYSLGRKEWLKDVRLNLGRNPWAVIADLNHNATVVAIGSHSKLAFSLHRVDGIINEVGPDLIELAAERIHQKRNTLVVALYSDSALELVVQDSERGFQAFHDIDILHRRLVHVGIFLDRADQVRNSRCAAFDFIQQVRYLDRGGNPHQSGSGSAGIEDREQRFQRFRLDVLPCQIGRQLPQVVLAVTAQ